jgi:hypothetical protein
LFAFPQSIPYNYKQEYEKCFVWLLVIITDKNLTAGKTSHYGHGCFNKAPLAALWQIAWKRK